MWRRTQFTIEPMHTNPYEPSQVSTTGVDQPTNFNSLPSSIALTAMMVSMGLFAASLTQDCFFIDRPSNPRAWSLGIVALLLGWMSGVPAWFANPALFATWATIWIRQIRWFPLITAAVALIFSASFLTCTELITNEAGGKENVTGYGLGYWLWLSSCGVAFAGTFVAQLVAIGRPPVAS